MPIQFKNVAKELAKLQAQQDELLRRMEILQRQNGLRAQLLAFIKKNDLVRGDLLWAWQQIPPTRITRKARLQRIAEAQGEKPPPPLTKGGKARPRPKPELIPMGLALHAARRAKNMTNRLLAAKIGMNPAMVSTWEKGFWRMKPDVLAKINKVLGANLKYESIENEGEKT